MKNSIDGEYLKTPPVLSRIIHSTESEITLRGWVGRLLKVGIGFHYGLTCRENTYFNGAIMAIKKREIVKFAEMDQKGVGGYDGYKKIWQQNL